MIRKIFVFILFCSVFSLAGGEFDGLTEGLWHTSIPENNGEIKPFGADFRFRKDGTVEQVYSGQAAELHEKMRARYKERTGKDLPEPRITWSVKDGKLHFQVHIRNGDSSVTRTIVYTFSEDPRILIPDDRKSISVLAREGARFTPEQAKRFFAEVKEATRDKFADGLKLPEKVPLAEPEKERWISLGFVLDGEHPHWKDAPAGSFQQAVVSAIGKGPGLPDNARCEIPSLEKLLSEKDGRELLLQYLACHVQWRLYPERDGTLHAVRYFCDPEGVIVPHLHQYYSCFRATHTDGEKVGDPALEFQFRLDIGFGGKAWNSSPLYPRDKTEHKDNVWHTRFLCGPALVDIFDQSQFPGRQMTRAALDFLEKEFAALSANRKNWRSLLPPNSSRKGDPDLILRNGMQGGIYEGFLWCDPGEKGTIYLKAFEITKGTPLSAERLKHSSACVSGWSEDPNEQFCSGLYFTIYEGEWDQFYGARFEVWFKPDKGGPERKLFEKNYRIQGWQR